MQNKYRCYSWRCLPTQYPPPLTPGAQGGLSTPSLLPPASCGGGVGGTTGPTEQHQGCTKGTTSSRCWPNMGLPTAELRLLATCETAAQFFTHGEEQRPQDHPQRGHSHGRECGHCRGGCGSVRPPQGSPSAPGTCALGRGCDAEGEAAAQLRPRCSYNFPT